MSPSVSTHLTRSAACFAVLSCLSLALWKVLRHGMSWTVLVGLFLLVHPAWTASARRGDCGMFRAEASHAVTVAAMVPLACQVILGHWAN